MQMDGGGLQALPASLKTVHLVPQGFSELLAGAKLWLNSLTRILNTTQAASQEAGMSQQGGAGLISGTTALQCFLLLSVPHPFPFWA